jgi:hypothetical protein
VRAAANQQHNRYLNRVIRLLAVLDCYDHAQTSKLTVGATISVTILRTLLSDDVLKNDGLPLTCQYQPDFKAVARITNSITGRGTRCRKRSSTVAALDLKRPSTGFNSSRLASN